MAAAISAEYKAMAACLGFIAAKKAIMAAILCFIFLVTRT
jgi:hypothetical protein